MRSNLPTVALSTYPGALLSYSIADKSVEQRAHRAQVTEYGEQFYALGGGLRSEDRTQEWP